MRETPSLSLYNSSTNTLSASLRSVARPSTTFHGAPSAWSASKPTTCTLSCRPSRRCHCEKRTMYFVACTTPGVASTVDSFRSEYGTPISMYGTRAAVIHRSACDRNGRPRSEEHTSELQSRSDLVCRLLLEKKKMKSTKVYTQAETT